MFYFRKEENPHCKDLVLELSKMDKKDSNTMAIDIIEKLKLDHEDFPILLMNLEEKGVHYNYR